MGPNPDLDEISDILLIWLKEEFPRCKHERFKFQGMSWYQIQISSGHSFWVTTDKVQLGNRYAYFTSPTFFGDLHSYLIMKGLRS